MTPKPSASGPPAANSLDAVSDRDCILETYTAGATSPCICRGFAEELVI